MTLEQAANTKPVPQAHVLLLKNHPGECEHILDQLFHEQTENYGKRWYPALETCDDPTELNKIGRRIYDEIIILRDKEQLKQTQTKEGILSKFKWGESSVNEDEKAKVERFSVKYHSFFTKNRLNNGINRVQS